MDGEDNSKILSEEERDSFTGTTIDENGNAHTYEDKQRDVFRDRVEQEANQGGFRVYTTRSSGCGWVMFFCVILLCLFLGMFFFVLPWFIIAGAVLALIGAVMRYFR